MTTDALIRIAALCVVLAGVETLHGIVRTVWVVSRIGKDLAIRLSALTGSLLALGICWLLVPPIGLQGAGQHLALGVVLAVFMAGFDIAIGIAADAQALAQGGAGLRPAHRQLPLVRPRVPGDRALAGLDVPVAGRAQRSFAPLPARICGRAFSIRATRVAAVLAEERWIT